MQFINTILAAALGLTSVASAINTIQFVNQDSTTRHIVFTSEADLGLAAMPDLVLEGMETKNQTFATGFIGNAYSYNDGAPNVPGMLAEVRFDGWDSLVFFDVSAIVNPDDTEGVKMIYPLGMDPTATSTPTSGCNSIGKCLNQYNAWNDIATQTTKSSNLVCLLGNKATTATRRAIKVRGNDVYPRDFVLGTEDSQ